MNTYHSLGDLIGLIDSPNSARCRQIYEDNRIIFETSPGSPGKHQHWTWGYLDHVTEVMNIGIFMYEAFHLKRRLDFTLSDALLVLFLHDLEKPWKLSQSETAMDEFLKHKEDKAFLEAKTAEYGFELTENHWNALKYVHGEGKDFNPHTRVQKPLAAFVHLCDTASARIWFDYPKTGGSW